MMDAGFFVGRRDIIDWINDTLLLNVEKIEQTASGAIACQLLDVMYPGNVPMHKVNWSATKDFEFIANYKILQTCFAKLSITRGVDVNRLIQGRYQDNLEFMQWYKRFFETTTAGGIAEYDPISQRVKGKGGSAYNDQYGRAGGSSGPRPPGAVSSSSANPTPRTKIGNNSSIKKPKPLPGSTATPRTTKAAAASAPPKPPAIDKGLGANHSEPDAAVLAELNDLKAINEEMKQARTENSIELDRVEKERDFYFEKLRDIEMMLQDLEDNGEGTELTSNIFKILYATADGFEAAQNEDGTGVAASFDADESAFGTF